MSTSAMTPGFSDHLEISNGSNFTEVISFFDGGLLLLPGIEIYTIDFGFGLKYQMIGNSQENGIVASIKAGTINVNYEKSNSNLASIEYSTKGNEFGISAGYCQGRYLPYASYVIKNYDVLTTIEDQSQRYQGDHKTVAVGLDVTFSPDASRQGSSLTLEASKTKTAWDQEFQNLAIDYGLLYSYLW